MNSLEQKNMPDLLKINTRLVQALKKVSAVLGSNLEPDATFSLILDELKSIYDYDGGFILYFDGDGVSFKQKRSFFKVDNFSDKVPELGLLTRKFIKEKKIQINNVNESANSLLSEVGITVYDDSSYIAAPLMFQSTIFGLLIIVKQQHDYFTGEDFTVTEAFSQAASYAVKDTELSNVFEMQLKALRDNVIKKTKAYGIIKEQNEKILVADRLKNEFLANMSHELRTPLNAIIGFSEALKLKIFGDINAKQEEYVQDIYSSGVHLLGMINDLLDIAKIEANAMKLYKTRFNICQITNESINIIESLASMKKISVKVNYKDNNIELYADQQKYQQIMYNLLSNAIKFTDENGCIEVGIKQINRAVQIYVKDNGIGIDAKYHGKIFAKFQQVDNSYTRKQSSTGLGLTITKELIELHNGKIRIESRLNQGTTFIFELPQD